MDLTVAVLALLSAFLHPFWNLLIKGDRYPEGAYFALALQLCLLGAAHAAWVGVDLLSARAVWPLLLLAAAGEFVYGLSLLVTLRRGELSVYYPIIRSSPLFIVVVGFLFFGERYSVPLLIGIVLVVAGAFCLQYRRGSRLLHDPLALGAALLAMTGAGIYALADARALQSIQPMVRFFWVELVQLPLFMYYFARARAPGETFTARLFSGWRLTPWRYLAVGMLAYASYFLILLAFKLGGNVAAVTALRQASIPMSVLLGAFYLRETSMLSRLSWSLVVAVGIVVIVVSPRAA